jgi:hypothetical protein
MWYKINYNILSLSLLPTFLRKLKLVSYLKVLIEPIKQLYYNWFQFRSTNLYKLAHTGQVCYLRKVLNDEFDPQDRRIRIGNGQRYERLYIYTRSENKPTSLGTVYLHARSDYADTGVDFIVYAPTSILDTMNYKMKALIDYYKEGVKRYKIQAE